jgi:hypothetical protein
MAGEVLDEFLVGCAQAPGKMPDHKGKRFCGCCDKRVDHNEEGVDHVVIESERDNAGLVFRSPG